MRKPSKSGKRAPAETVGIDLGDKVSRYGVVNQDGEVVEEGNFRNQVSSLENISGEPRAIALETGSQSGWISRELKGLGHEVIVANARELKWITASDRRIYRSMPRSCAVGESRRAFTCTGGASQAEQQAS